jgi:hypothetical protein
MAQLMTTKVTRTLLAFSLSATFVLVASVSMLNAATESNYFAAIGQELTRLDIEARCNETTLSCAFTRDLEPSGPRFDVVVKYSRKTDTIYVFIDKFITLADVTGPSAALARRLLDLNREMVTAKFEWDKNTNTIRLSTSMSTDSNFDRRAFRAQVLGLLSLAQKLWPELGEGTKETKETKGTE